MLNRDFKDMLRCLLAEKVDFLLVGGYALAAHGHPRATKDMDIWVWSAPNNSERLYRALSKFGAPLDQITPHEFAAEGIVFQVGVAPNRIDIITKADGVDFVECQRNAISLNLEGIEIPVISKQDLILNKQASARPQDLVDVGLLEKASKK